MKTLLSSQRDHYMARVSICLAVVGLIVGIVGCTSGPMGFLPIRTWYDLDAIRGNLGASYVLMNDLDSATEGYAELASEAANGGKGWEPIGTYNESDPERAFTGYFDGQACEIRDLFIDRPDEDGIGLFGVVDAGGSIKDLGLAEADVIGKERVGGLVGENRANSSLSRCYSSGAVAGETRVGGLVGLNEGGIVTNSRSSAEVTGESAVGGLVGYNLYDGTVSNSYSSATVTGGSQYIGGLVGANYYADVINSHYNYDEVLVSGQNIITTGALFAADFDQWLANDKFLDVNERLSEEDGYYLIEDVEDFKQLLAFGQDGSLKFELQNDLDLGSDPDFFIPYLAGEFDGGGHKIRNLSFGFDFVSQVGLFGYVARGAEISGVGAESVAITGARSVGGLAGANQGTVSHCYSTGSLRNTRQVGGLVGGNGGIVTWCYSTADVSGYHLLGGLVGGNAGTVSHSYATGAVAGDQNSVGGLVGGNTGTISNSYSTGSATGLNYVGGLVGHSGEDDDGSATVGNCYSTGAVTATQFVGGLLGCNIGAAVINSYCTGNVTGKWDVGGLVGSEREDGSVHDSFWDMETCGIVESVGGTGKTTSEMRNIVTFTDAATEGLDEPWEIIAVAPDDANDAYIWNIVDGQTYPFLSWQS